MTFWKFHKIPILITFLSIVFYFSFAYDLIRTDYVKLLSLYTALFILFYFLLRTVKNNFKFLVIIAFLFRLIFLLSIPNLSQDFYRFIWDGRLILQGISPYSYTPDFLISSLDFTLSQGNELHSKMGALSANHYSNYTPLNQIYFIIAGLISGKSILGSVIILRVFIIIADFGTLFFGQKLLKKLNIPVHNIFWYILNPFIIIELTGNLHFEGIMIFFLVWSLWLLHQGKWMKSALMMALSVSMKLLPLLFLPLLYKYLGFKKSLFYSSIVGIFSISLFAPFYSSQFFLNYSETISLYFQKFEFNASIYYVIREISFVFRGFNEIAIIGKIMPLIVFLIILILAFKGKNKSTVQVISTMLIGISIYFFLSTTVHPWYLATLVLLSVFTNYKFPIVWSFVIVLSYLAYSNNAFLEKNWVIVLEYSIVYGVFLWEVFTNKNKLQHHERI